MTVNYHSIFSDGLSIASHTFNYASDDVWTALPHPPGSVRSTEPKMSEGRGISIENHT